MTDTRHPETTANIEARYPPPDVTRKGRPFSIAAFICAAVAVLFLPPVLGIAVVILGFVARARGDRQLGLWAIIASVAGAVIGMVLGAVVMNATDDNAAMVLGWLVT